MSGSSPLSPLPKNASRLEREFAEQSEKVVRLARERQFGTMPAQQQRLEQLKAAVRAERAAAKMAKAGER